MCVCVCNKNRQFRERKKKRNDKGNDNQNGIFCMHAWYGIEMPNFSKLKKDMLVTFFWSRFFSVYRFKFIILF